MHPTIKYLGVFLSGQMNAPQRTGFLSSVNFSLGFFKKELLTQWSTFLYWDAEKDELGRMRLSQLSHLYSSKAFYEGTEY